MSDAQQTPHGEDLLVWLESAITTREQAAQHAPGSNWRAEDADTGYGEAGWENWKITSTTPAGTSRSIAGPGYEGGGIFGEEAAQHIALNDPESVLRRCTADRRIMERHVPNYSEPAGALICGYDGRRWPCSDITDLAEGYDWAEAQR
ncbi:DUF6221 family protein [Streptomyces sp. NPDC060243]|uniref:DUF6221 family protein n=1 Tax=Streptomyces sp. NPDC060243 TaxID=3347081 RepID=UPI0036675EC0